MDANQLGRRNLTPDNFRWILGRRYNRTKKAGFKGNQHTVGKDQIDPQQTTATKLAEEHGVGEATVKRAGKFAEEVENTPELKQAMEQGKSQREVAKDVGVHHSTVQDVIGGKRKTCEIRHPEPFTRGLNSFAMNSFATLNPEPRPEGTGPSIAELEPMTLPGAGSPPCWT